MTKEEVIQHLCETVACVFHTKHEYEYPSDGFCRECERDCGCGDFQHSGRTLAYVRDAVIEKLIRDGYKPAFDTFSESEKDPK